MSTHELLTSDYLFAKREDVSLELQCLVHSDRFAITALLFGDDRSFGYLKDQLNISKTALANHLQMLTQQKIIRKIRRGVYHLSENGRVLLDHLSQYLIDRQKREKLKWRHLQSLETVNTVKIMKIETNSLVKDVTFQPAWITYAGAMAGVLQAFGEDYDVADILGYSGYAFLSNVSTKSTHIAAPTATKFFEDFDTGIESLGYPLNGVWDEGAIFGKQGLNKNQISRLNSLYNVIKQQLDHDNPVILWGLAAAEFGIVTGYEDEYLEVSTFRSHISGMQDDSIHYTELDAPGGLWAYYFGRKEKDLTEETDRSAVERALKIITGDRGSTIVGSPREKWELEQMDYISGPEAYGRWSRNVKNNDIDQMGNSYVLALYTEGRKAAATFFERLNTKYKERNFANNLQELAKHYQQIYEILARNHEIFPFPTGNEEADIIEALSKDLDRLMELETKSIELVKNCLTSWN